MRIQPARRIHGELQLPGDKSISHRAAILSALSIGRSQIKNFSSSRDCLATLNCLRQLGVNIESEGTTVVIDGVGLKGLQAPLAPLDCGNSGTTIRLLAGVLAGRDFDSTLTGDESLRMRPMKRIIEPLELMGAHIDSDDGRAPLRIHGQRKLHAIQYRMPIESAQVKSCILLAGLNADGRTEVIGKQGATRDHTERMLAWLEVPTKKSSMEEDGATLEGIAVDGGFQFSARDGAVPGDISSASFFITAAALLPHSKLTIKQVGLNPTRTKMLSLVRSLGADVLLEPGRTGSAFGRPDFNEPFGNLIVMNDAFAPDTRPEPTVLRGHAIAQLIDELPILAVLGTQLRGGISIRDASELRHKESDRISAVVENLRAMGAAVEEHEDGFTIHERTVLKGAILRSFGDHRIAMAFTVAALIAEGESEILDPECVDVSFPEFFDLLNSVIER